MESYYTPCKEFDACNELIERATGKRVSMNNVFEGIYNLQRRGIRWQNAK